MFKRNFIPLTFLVAVLFLALACRTVDTLTHLGAVPTSTRARPARTATRRVTRSPLKTQAPHATATSVRAVTDVPKTPTNAPEPPTKVPEPPTKAPAPRPTAAPTDEPAASPTHDPQDDSSP